MQEPLAEKPHDTCLLYVLQYTTLWDPVKAHWLMVWISRMYAMQAAFSPSMWTFGVTIDCWIETPGVAGTGGRGEMGREKMRRGIRSKRGEG